MSSVNGTQTIKKKRYVSNITATTPCIGCGAVMISGAYTYLPLCMSVCLSNAISNLGKYDCWPVIDSEKCIGCADCVNVCPENYIELEKYRGR